MFSKRCQLNGSRKYSRNFFERFVSDLRSSGFTNISVLLPHNWVPHAESTVTIDDLLKRERNYPALVLVARAEERNETLKVLFVNRNSKAVFIDDTFPNGESEPPQLYFQSPDPARTYAVFNFFREYLQRPGLERYYLLWFGSIVSFLFLLGQVLSVVGAKSTLLHLRFKWHFAFDVVGIAVALAFIYAFFGEPKGLWIKPSRELRLFYLANMALRGDLRDNPLVSVLVTVVTTILTTVLLKWLGLL